MGWVNYWVTIPFLAIYAVGALAMVAVPDRIPGDKPRWQIRTLGLVCLCVAPVMGWLAFDEARTNPNCDASGAVADGRPVLPPGHVVPFADPSSGSTKTRAATVTYHRLGGRYRSPLCPGVLPFD